MATETTITTQTLHALKGILAKPYPLRSDHEKHVTISTLEENSYFRRYINDLSQRREYIGEMAQYLKYVYYPQGTLICNHGEYGFNFGILLRGEAFLYAAKKKSDIEDEQYTTDTNCELIEMYKRYIETEGINRKLKKWQHANPQGRRAGIIGDFENSPYVKNNGHRKSFSGSFKLLQDTETDLKSVVNEVLRPNNTIFVSSKKEKDLSLEEKLLLLHHNGLTKNYFKNGIATFKKEREVKSGESIGEVCLTTDLTIEHTIIASEDLYLITISKENFRTLSLSKVDNVVRKKEFFWQLFPNLTVESIIKLCAYVEERVIVNWDYVYKEDDEANAIYIVKQGQVQLITFNKEEKTDVSSLPSNINQKVKKYQSSQKSIVSSVEVGGIFGEEEVINKTKRKYTAVCNAALVSLYVLKKRVFYDLFEAYFSYISNEFKSVLEAKTVWKERRIQQEKKAIEEALNSPYTLSQGTILSKTARLMESTGAKYHKSRKSEVPHMIMETKHTNVIKYEQRKSRIYKNKIEIIVYDNNISSKDQISKNESLSLKSPLKRPSVSPDAKILATPKTPNTPNRVHKIKSNLFEQNQDFRKWKKYYDFLSSSRSQTKSSSRGPPTISIPRTSHSKPSTAINSYSTRSFPKLTINCENIEPQTCSELPKTTNEAVTSENNIASLTSINSPKAIAPAPRNFMRTTSLSPRPATEALSKRTKEAVEPESSKLMPNSAHYLKRVLSGVRRRASIEADLPKPSINSLNYLSATGIEDDMGSTKPSLQVFSTKGIGGFYGKISPKSFVYPVHKPKSMSISMSATNLDITTHSISRIFISNQGKECPKMIVINSETPRKVHPPLSAKSGKRVIITNPNGISGDKYPKMTLNLSKQKI